LQDGSHYSGEWKEGMYNGQGMFKFSIGGYYNGQWYDHAPVFLPCDVKRNATCDLLQVFEQEAWQRRDDVWFGRQIKQRRILLVPPAVFPFDFYCVAPFVF